MIKFCKLFFQLQFRSHTAGEIYAVSIWDSVEVSDTSNMSLTASKSGLRNFRNTLLTVLNCKNLSNKQYYLHIKLRNVPVYVPIYWYKLYRYIIQLGHRELSRKYNTLEFLSQNFKSQILSWSQTQESINLSWFFEYYQKFYQQSA